MADTARRLFLQFGEVPVVHCYTHFFNKNQTRLFFNRYLRRGIPFLRVPLNRDN